MPLSDQQKKYLLTLINNEKHILFGSYTPSLTREKKSETWMDIVKRRISVSGFDPTNCKGWQYLRDTTWPNMRQYSVKKRDLTRRSGASGGIVLTEVDHLIFEIIGKDSPGLEGLPVRDQVIIAPPIIAPTDEPSQSSRSSPPTSPNRSFLAMLMDENRDPECPSPAKRRAVTTSLPKKQPTFRDKFEALKLRKMELEIEILEIQRNGLLRNLHQDAETQTE